MEEVNLSRSISKKATHQQAQPSQVCLASYQRIGLYCVLSPL